MGKVVITVESLINNPNQDLLSHYGKIQQSISRTLFNFLINNPTNKDTFKILQKQYKRKYNITVRLFKSIWIDVNSKIASLKTRRKQQISYYEQKVEKFKTKKLKKRKLFRNHNKINNLIQRRDNLLTTIINNTWGSKKLLEQQEATAEWKQEWQRQRDHHIYLVGSKDEKFGNNLAQLQTLNKLRLTLPNELGQNHLELEVNFNYEKKNYDYLRQAISNGQALTYKITQRNNGKWYVFVSFSIENDCNNQFASLGIDINYNLIATCLIKPDGNPEKFNDYKFDFEKLDKNQIKQKLCDISSDIINQAKENNKNIVIENLDLDKCKAVSDNKISNRKLHMIAYSKFINLIKSKAVKLGVLVIETNPAFTSVIGKLKYKKKLGRSVHSCASFTIGRRGMNFQEKVPSKLHSLLYGKDLMKPNWKKWSILSKKSATVLNNSDSTLLSNHFLSELLGNERENKRPLIFNPTLASHNVGTVY